MTDKSEAISLMNSLGKGSIPFLFIIDFEMKAIRIFPHNKPLPTTILYNFSGSEKSKHTERNNKILEFKKFPISFDQYIHAFEDIQNQIHAGNTFLANLTFPTPVETNLTLKELFFKSRAKYKLLVDNEFVCFSPEAFVTIADGTISTFPMKGTLKATSPGSESRLLNDSKEIAEHNTVVDLLRNDLSMVSSNVTVKRFRYVDRISLPDGELLQVSSEICGNLPGGYQSRLGEIIFTMLPAGSVTGAPKNKTVAIIRAAEKADRGYYTGVCGVFDGKDLNSAVMIRYIENCNGSLRFRSGGGITFLSDARTEYEELKDKVYVPVV